jgi:hypothetical protein
MVLASLTTDNKQYLEMIHTVSACMARFTIWAHCYIQKRQISQDMDNLFTTLLKLRVHKEGNKLTGQVNPFALSYKSMHQVKLYT